MIVPHALNTQSEFATAHRRWRTRSNLALPLHLETQSFALMERRDGQQIAGLAASVPEKHPAFAGLFLDIAPGDSTMPTLANGAEEAGEAIPTDGDRRAGCLEITAFPPAGPPRTCRTAWRTRTLQSLHDQFRSAEALCVYGRAEEGGYLHRTPARNHGASSVSGRATKEVRTWTAGR